MRGIFADYVEWKVVLAELLRFSFVAFTPVFAKIVANWSLAFLDFWNEHRDMSITDVRNRFRRYSYLFRSDSDAFSYAFPEVKNYLS